MSTRAITHVISFLAQEDTAADDTRKGSKVLAIMDEKWPVQGKVEFDNYAASYRPGVLPDVLRSLTFEILPREKVRLPSYASYYATLDEAPRCSTLTNNLDAAHLRRNWFQKDKTKF